MGFTHSDKDQSGLQVAGSQLTANEMQCRRIGNPTEPIVRLEGRDMIHIESVIL